MIYPQHTDCPLGHGEYRQDHAGDPCPTCWHIENGEACPTCGGDEENEDCPDDWHEE